MKTPTPRPETFDAAYYRRYYEQHKTKVADQRSTDRLCAFVLAYLDYLQIPVRSALDLGCGVGLWRDSLQRMRPKARYHGVEYSSYLCERLGWTQGSAVDFKADRTYDLVICQGVLQYLDDDSATKAIANLGKLTGGALYLEALTKKDWRQNVDRKRTDGAVHLRTGAFYQERLRRRFVPVGGGVFVPKRSGVALFELEALG